MDEYFKKIKDKLKSIKKEFKELLNAYQSELDFCREVSEKMSVIKMGYENGLGISGFDKEGLNKLTPTFGECIKYENELECLRKCIENNGLVIDNPDITIRATKSYGKGIAVSYVEDERIIDFLSEKQYPSKVANVGDLFEKFLIGDGEQAFSLSKVYFNFYTYVWAIDNYISNLDMIIKAIDNNKIKAPIKDISIVYANLVLLGIPSNDISKILGRVIAYNSNYAKKNSNHNIKDIDLINALATYYNQDGTFKEKVDISTFQKLLTSLKERSLDYFNMVSYLINFIRIITKDKSKFGDNYLVSYLFCDKVNEDIIKLLEDSRINDSSSKFDIPKPNVVSAVNANPNNRIFLDKLRKFYKNGEIIAIPDDIELFYQELENSNLDIKEKTLIKRMMEQTIVDRKNQVRLSYLDDKDKLVYEMATKLVETLGNDNPDMWQLKQYLEDIHDIFEVLDNEDNDKETWLRELSNIMNRIALLCSKYMREKDVSTNRYLFLLNKNDVPYVYEDYEGLDPIYKKNITSLISRIVPENVSKFKPVKNIYKLEYQMYEYYSQSTHIVFVEIIPGIYVIIGADKARVGYETFNNRLRNNQLRVQQMIAMVMNEDSRNKILKQHEEYLDLFICDKKNPKKRVLVES